VAGKDIGDVKKSLGRSLIKGDVFGTFYDIFLQGDPRILERFQNTEWEEQKRLLRQGVNNVLSFYEGSATAKSTLDRLRETHGSGQMNIPPDLYDVWVESMIHAVGQHDDQFDDELAEKWREVLTYGVDYVRSGYEEP